METESYHDDVLRLCLRTVPLLSPLHLPLVLAVFRAEERLDLATTSQVEPCAQEYYREVEKDEDPHDTKIAPID